LTQSGHSALSASASYSSPFYVRPTGPARDHGGSGLEPRHRLPGARQIENKVRQRRPVVSVLQGYGTNNRITGAHSRQPPPLAGLGLRRGRFTGLRCVPALPIYLRDLTVAGDGTANKKARSERFGRAVGLYRLEGCGLISSRRSLTRARA
jgi:hypothetical protein